MGLWDKLLTVSAILILAIRPATDIFSNSRDPTASTALRPSPVVGLLVLLIAGLVAVKRIRNRLPLWPDRHLRTVHYWLFAAYGIGLLSGALGYGSEGLFVGVRELVRAGSTVAAFLLILWWVEDRPRRYSTGWVLLFLGAIAPLAVAVWQWSAGRGYAETVGFNRLSGTFSHPHSLGPYLVPFILVTAAGLLAASWKGKILRLAGIWFFTLILVHTYSRTSLLVLLAALFVLPVLSARKYGPRGVLRSLAEVAVVLAMAWGIAGESIRERFNRIALDREALEAAKAGQSENSFTWRIYNWGILVRMGIQRPVIGHGAGMTTVLNPLVNKDYGGKPFNAHNDFVRWLFEAGALGVICYVIYGVLLCRWALRRSMAANSRAGPAALAVVAALIAMIFLSLGTTEYSSQTAVLYQFHGMLALLSVVPVAEIEG